MKHYNRRDFIRSSLIGGAAISFLKPFEIITSSNISEIQGTSVSISAGDDRADMVFRALKPFSKQIKQVIGNRHVVLKPNNVLIYVPLACTHVETLEGILEFLKSISKINNVIIAESSASGSTVEGFDNYGYYRLLSKYPVKLVDLDEEPFEIMYVLNERDFRPYRIKVSRELFPRTHTWFL